MKSETAPLAELPRMLAEETCQNSMHSCVCVRCVGEVESVIRRAMLAFAERAEQLRDTNEPHPIDGRCCPATYREGWNERTSVEDQLISPDAERRRQEPHYGLLVKLDQFLHKLMEAGEFKDEAGNLHGEVHEAAFQYVTKTDPITALASPPQIASPDFDWKLNYRRIALYLHRRDKHNQYYERCDDARCNPPDAPYMSSEEADQLRKEGEQFINPTLAARNSQLAHPMATRL